MKAVKIYNAIGLILCILLIRCTTQKNTFITRTYHNTTAKYNILFNGSESYKKGIRKIDESYQYDFNEILPVFLYGTDEIASMVSGEMDRSIKKGTKLISMHSITVKPELKSNKPLSPEKQKFYNKKEFNKWVDNNYLLMGKAYFYKNEYDLAIETFRFILNTFEDPEILYLTNIWLARTYIQIHDYESAEEILENFNKDEQFPDKYQVQLQTILADYHLKQKQFASAIPYLEYASKNARGKNNKIRYTYILAQIYNIAGNSKQAIENYGKVIKMNPPYATTFNAKISQALSYESGLEGSRSITKQLEKMLKDDKNIEYQDQIYYALGNISFEEGNMDQAIQYYILSASKSVSNTNQKVRSVLTIADIYYEAKEYEKAQQYYDSSITILNNDYPDYDLIFAKARSLTNLVIEIRTVKFEDSVQILAEMSTNELYEYIDQVIEDVIRKEEEEKQLQMQRLLDKQYQAELNANKIQDPTSKANWYFYNETAKALGRKEFITKWGNRRLEDNWRRRNKSTISIEEIASEDSDFITDEEKNAQAIMSNKTREYYLKDIPLNDSLLALSHQRIEKALYKMANIYESDLADFEQTIIAYKELIDRYPDTKNKLDSYYSLYKIYKKQENRAMMESYKNRIIKEFPNSNYTKLLTNPDYIKEIEAEQNKVKNLYARIYNDYQAGRHNQVFIKTENAVALYPDDELIPKFMYLHALATGKTKDTKIFREALVNLVSKYPQTDIAEESKNIIAYIDSYKPALKEEKEAEIAKEIYVASAENQEHYCILVLEDENIINYNQLIFNIINFNLDFFDDLNLNASKEKIDDQEQIILIRSFKKKSQAMRYYRRINSYEDLYRDIDSKKLETFFISKENYSILKKDKSISRYIKYFNGEYL